jgi:uncharacterized cysteine cluster protein YcgN (CxxCxxCC family)
MADQPFWRTKSLGDMTAREWESLCDGCGKCCLIKLEDEDTGEYYFTDVACRLLDTETCRCSRYKERHRFVPDCITLTPETIGTLGFMPSTCAYRLLAEGKDLPDWHPLVCGRADGPYRARVTARYRCISEDAVEEEDLPGRIVNWPR